MLLIKLRKAKKETAQPRRSTWKSVRIKNNSKIHLIHYTPTPNDQPIHPLDITTPLSTNDINHLEQQSCCHSVITFEQDPTFISSNSSGNSIYRTPTSQSSISLISLPTPIIQDEFYQCENTTTSDDLIIFYSDEDQNMHEIRLEYVNEQEDSSKNNSDNEEEGVELPIHRHFSISNTDPPLPSPIRIIKEKECFLKYDVRWSSLFSTKEDLWRASQLFIQVGNDQEGQKEEGEEYEIYATREKSI